MAKNKPLKKIIQSGFRRRAKVAFAGVEGGARLLGSHASSVFKTEEEKQSIRSQALEREAKVFAQKLGELKGAYVKIGQMMAMYGDHFLPKEVTQALRSFESETEPLDWSAIQPAIIKELGDLSEELEIEQAPLACASLSQVHRAHIKKTGEQLCLKIQYPGVANTISSDFDLVQQMLRFSRWVPSSKEFEAWLIEIKEMLLDEVDYHREAKMMTKLARLVKDDPRYDVPKVYKRYSGQTILAMRFLPGEVVTADGVQKLSLKRRNDLGFAMLENFFDEVFEWGVMQTDPNFGNYRINIASPIDDSRNKKGDRINLLDFGAVRHLSKSFSTTLQQLILAAYRQDQASVIKGAIKLGCLQKDQSDEVKHSFASFCILLMEPFSKDHASTPKFALNKNSQYKWRESKLLKRVGKQGAKAIAIEGFSSPPKEFALIARKLSGVFTFITALNAEFNAYPIIQKYL